MPRTALLDLGAGSDRLSGSARLRRSDTGSPATWTWHQWPDDVAAFCQALDIPRPVLVGTSSGALVAMNCAARHPELVAGLILDSPLGAPTSLTETLDVFERRGGSVARGAACRYVTGDTGDRATAAWEQHALPLYGDTQHKPTRGSAGHGHA